MSNVGYLFDDTGLKVFAGLIFPFDGKKKMAELDVFWHHHFDPWENLKKTRVPVLGLHPYMYNPYFASKLSILRIQDSTER
jgi:hypothetical protein